MKSYIGQRYPDLENHFTFCEDKRINRSVHSGHCLQLADRPLQKYWALITFPNLVSFRNVLSLLKLTA
jgi:hypothetical protein